MMRVILAAAAVAGAAAACDPAAIPSIPPTPPAVLGVATVTGTESGGDKTTPSGLTYYADCRATDGTDFRVAITASATYTVGQPCPSGPHLPTARQENQGAFDAVESALNQPLPYSGGDENGPCGGWAAADQAIAAQAQAAWQRCMADPQHHG